MFKTILFTISLLAAVATWLFWDDLTAHWEVSTVNGDTITCVWTADTNKTKTVIRDPFVAYMFVSGDDCPPQ